MPSVVECTTANLRSYWSGHRIYHGLGLVRTSPYQRSKKREREGISLELEMKMTPIARVIKLVQMNRLVSSCHANVVWSTYLIGQSFQLGAGKTSILLWNEGSDNC